MVYAMFTKFNVLQSVGIIIFGIFGDLMVGPPPPNPPPKLA